MLFSRNPNAAAVVLVLQTSIIRGWPAPGRTWPLNRIVDLDSMSGHVGGLVPLSAGKRDASWPGESRLDRTGSLRGCLRAPQPGRRPRRAPEAHRTGLLLRRHPRMTGRRAWMNAVPQRLVQHPIQHGDGPPLLAPLLVTMVGGDGPAGRDTAAREVSGAASGSGNGSRFPGFDAVAEAGHWDPVTAGAVLSRGGMPPGLRFFTSA